jgi:deoxyinosine 3'endonuclease (endonuclease V)
MIYAFDTYYFENSAHTVCIGFENWKSENFILLEKEESRIDGDYISGQFYKRELPCILRLLQRIDLKTEDCIVIDGFVVLNDEGALGLGGYLYEALHQKCPVVGVAKSNFATLNRLKRPIFRGKSQKPIFVTAIGIDLDEAAAAVQEMFGEYRLPHLLKCLDLHTRTKD